MAQHLELTLKSPNTEIDCIVLKKQFDMCFLAKYTSWIRVDKKTIWRASSRGGKV